jgi:elongation factor P
MRFSIYIKPLEVYLRQKRYIVMYNAADLKKGLKIQIDGEPYIIIDFQFSKPGKGQSLYRCKLKNMISNTIVDRTYRSGDTFEPANLEERKMQYLYNQEDEFFFMDLDNYEQSMLKREQIGEAKNYLTDNLEVNILFFSKRPIGMILPNFVDMTVTHADPWVKGDSATSDSKPVTVETGYTLRVPPFIEEGTKITIDTRTGQYVTRVKE